MSARAKSESKVCVYVLQVLVIVSVAGPIGSGVLAQSVDLPGDGLDPNENITTQLNFVLNYLDTLPQSPDTEDAFKARQVLAVYYIKMGKQTEARSIIGELLTKYSEHPRLPHAIHTIAEQSNKPEKNELIHQVYQSLSADPEYSNQALWIKMGEAIAKVHEGDYEAVEQTIEQLVLVHGGEAGITEAVNQVAWSYRKVKRFHRALVLYQYALDNWPESERAIMSQRGRVLTHIGLGNDEAAWDAVETLKQEFAGDPLLDETIYDLAGKYKGSGKNAKSLSLYQFYVDNWPTHPQSLKCHRELALGHIGLGDNVSTQRTMDTIRNQFADHPKLPHNVYVIAREMGYGSNAASLYQFLIDNYPDDPSAIRAKGAQARIKIRQGNEAAANAILDKLLSDHAGHPILPRAVALIAQSYYDLAFAAENSGDPALANTLFQKSIAVWQVVIEDLPVNDKDTPEGYHLIGECYLRLGQPKKAITYYRQMLSRWPDYRNAWTVQFQIGYCYQQLKRQGVIAETEANDETSRAYRQVLAKYPTCKAAGAARSWLSKHK